MPIMILHYNLFAHGTWWNKRDHEADISVFDFAGPAHSNPQTRTIEALLSMLLDPGGAGRGRLSLMILKMGDDPRRWPPRIVRALHIALVIGISALWR